VRVNERAAWCAALAAALLCSAAPARADKETISLDYRASSGCPDRQQFVERVRTFTTKAEIVGDDGGAPRRRFGVQVVRTSSSVSGDLTIDDRGARTTRHVSGATCDEVISALALATAIAVDPDALGVSPKDEPTTPPATEPSTPPTPTPPKRVVPPPPAPPPRTPSPALPRPPSPPALFLRVGARVGDAIAPFPKVEGSAEFGFTYLAPVEFFVGGAYGPKQENSQVQVSEWLGWLGAGYRLAELEPFSVLTQASFELGRVEATGRIAEPFLTVRPAWAAVDVGLSGRLDGPGLLFFQADIDARAPVLLQRYVVVKENGTPNETQEVYQVGQLGFLLGLSVGMHFL
jgi:hypothetical protein